MLHQMGQELKHLSVNAKTQKVAYQILQFAGLTLLYKIGEDYQRYCYGSNKSWLPRLTQTFTLKSLPLTGER